MSKIKTKKLIVFTIGGKGGVGKSWLITLLIDWYLANKVPFLAVDLDNENNTLTRFFRDADFIEVSSERGLDAMIEKIVENETALTVIDMRAASTDRIAPWWKQVDFDSLRDQYGIRFTAIGVVDSSVDSVANIGFWATDVLQNSSEIHFVIAQNKVRGEELSYLASADRKNYQQTLKLAEIEIPKLEDWVHQMLEVGNLRINTALEIEDATHPLTKFMTRSRLKRYQQTIFAEFEKIKDRLLP